MAFLEKLDDDERDLIVALPYRVGVWVSQQDDSGGTEADYKEIEQLGRIINRKSEGMFQSAFVHEVMAETFKHRESWDKWIKNISVVPDECKKAVEIIEAKMSPKDLNAYRITLMEIATDVAEAFREFDLDTPFFAKVFSYIKLAIDKLVGGVKGEAYESERLLNISYEEDLALARLSQALQKSAPPENDA